jgi:hypothetical protein
MVEPDALVTRAARALTASFLVEHEHLGPTTRAHLKSRLQAALNDASEEPLSVLESLVADADLNAFDARRASMRWGRVYYLLGVPAVILAAAAGTTGLASTTTRVLAAVIALASAGFSATATFLNSQEQRKNSRLLGAAWQELADDARMELLQRVEALKSGTPAAKVFDVEYWTKMLALHRRKGRLLRGDLSAPVSTSEHEAQYRPREEESPQISEVLAQLSKAAKPESKAAKLRPNAVSSQ